MCAGETVTLQRRTAAYAADNPSTLKGHFPGGSKVEILEERGDGMVLVSFISPSGKSIQALCRRRDLGLHSAAAGASASPAMPVSRRESKDAVWRQIERDDVDPLLLTPRAEAVLADDEGKWKHARTEHFYIHYAHGIFARKVARMAEFFYQYIAEDLKRPRDILNGRSHIFVFKDKEHFEVFRRHATDIGGWAAAMAEGPTLYTQKLDDTHSSSHLLAHETTHLVINRFAMRRPPLWLNEGLGEWHGEFGRAAFKGVKKSRRTPFKKIQFYYDLDRLLNSEDYPDSNRDIAAYYQTSKFLVGYLRLKHSDEKFAPFLKDMISGKDTMESLSKHYNIEGIGSLSREFNKFAGL